MTMGGSGGGGTAGGKYILSFSVAGPGAQQLAQITNQLLTMAKGVTGGGQAVQGLINQINRLGSAAIANGAKVITLDAQIRMMKDGLESLKNVGDFFAGMGKGVLGTFYEMGKGILTSVSPLENASNQMMILGKMTREQASGIIAGVKELVAATPFKTNELVDLNTALVTGKATLGAYRDEMGKTITLNDAVRNGWGRLSSEILGLHGNMKVSATSIVADFAALTGNVGDRMPTFVRGIQRAFSTQNTRLLMDQVNAEALLALTGSGKLTKMEGTANDAIKRMYDYLKKYNAVGMAALASDTATGIMSNFEEIPMLIFQAMGGDATDPNSPYSKIKKAFAGLFREISSVINSDSWRAGVGAGVGAVIEMFRTVASWVGGAVAAVLKFFGDHPVITKWTTVAIAAGAALSVFLGTLLAVTAAAGIFVLTQYGMLTAWGLMKAALPGLRAELWATFAPILIPLAKFILIGAAVAGVVLLVHNRFKAFLNANQPIKDFLENVITFFGAIGEAMSNWDGDTSKISTETAGKLKKSGMLDIFLLLVRGMWQVVEVSKFMWAEFSGPLKDALNGIIDTIGEAFGLSLDDTGDKAKDFAGILEKVFRLVIIVIAKAGMYLSWFNFLFTLLKNVGQMAFTGLYAGAYAVYMIFSDIYTIISSIVRVLGNLTLGDFAGAAAALKEGVMNFHGTEGQNANWRAATGAWGEQAAGIGRAEGQFSKMYDLSERPIAGILDKDPRAGSRMDVGPVSQPVQFDQATLERLISSGKVGANEVNEGIKSGQIVVNAVLNVDGEKIAQKMIQVQGRAQSRSSRMQADPRFGG